MGDARQFHFDPDTYLSRVTSEVPLYAELQDRAAEATEGLTVRRFLDLGTGTGETALSITGRHPSARMVGIDESPDMLAHARRRLPEAEFRVGRLQDPLPSGPFDLVVSALAVHHLDGLAKARLFRSAAAVLVPSGHFVMADVIVPDDPDDAVTPIDGVHDKPSSSVDLMRWLDDAGFNARLSWSHRDLAVFMAERRR
jgi:tRNA (cmo5U34)-methyltransferase